MPSTIALVGAGPTTIYTLQALLDQAAGPLSIVILEEQARAGLGTPYRPGWNDPEMLANIASIELPPVGQTLVAWLAALPDERLARYSIARDAIDERALYPRVVLGHYLLDRFEALVARGREAGHAIEIRARTRVTDVAAFGERFFLAARDGAGGKHSVAADRLVIATGHEWPEEPEVRPGYFASPWPASALERIAAGPVGIRGTSLSAIDAAVALAVRHGRFVEQGGGAPSPVSVPLADAPLDWCASDEGAALAITMMSRKGLLPEAEYYHPIPEEPLDIFTDAAVDGLIDAGAAGLLARAFALFKQQLAVADPDWAARIGLDALDIEGFCEAYFADRNARDPFEWAQANLDEAKRNFARRHVVQWRYTILRAHEVFARVVPHLDETDYERFSKHLRIIFTDNYATVPHASIERLLALHRAGALEILALGQNCRIDSRTPDRGAIVHMGNDQIHYPAFIDATGQRLLEAEAFPFPSLLAQGIVQDAECVEGKRGIAIDDAFHPVSDMQEARRIHLLSLPFILGRHPFSQGLTSCHDMGEAVGREIAADCAEVGPTCAAGTGT